MKKLSLFVASSLLLTVAGAEAQMRAWEDRGFIYVNGGYQSGTQTLSDSGTFSLYSEQGRFDVDYDVDRSGGVFDVGVGIRVWRNLAVGFGFSRTSSEQVGNVTAVVPHPVFLNRARTTSDEVAGLDRSEVGVHLQAVWMLPVTDRIEVALSAGPSFFTVSQDFVSRVTFPDERNRTPAQLATVEIASAPTTEASESATGVNVGADITYLFTDQIGAGFFLRYAGGSADVALSAGTVSLDIGGFQVGGGIRLRF